MAPNLIFDDDDVDDDSYWSFPRFVERSLLLHEAPVIEKLQFKVGNYSGASNIRVWTRAALKRCVRNLIIKTKTDISIVPIILPTSLYTGCSMLVGLELKKVVLKDVASPISFPSLKKLWLKCVKYPDDNVTIFTIKVPSLKRLVLSKPYSEDTDIASGFMIDAPSLESFGINDECEGGFCVTDAFPVGTVFCSLVSLEIWITHTDWFNLLMRFLKDSPNLRALKLEKLYFNEDDDEDDADDDRPCWSEPSSIPECAIWSLETLEWSEYEGAEEDKQVIAFILRNAHCLKKATISTESTEEPNKKLQMLKELSLFPRRSPTCLLAFD
ncbi:PREDICTED: probable FBD-associated F-box protein At1g32375 [Camelina sativa]|uniref:Probable FBD-associated F-box protein At1g32375 n=1 Tax=Camelina sativa TaxID=90675 RepID=A0ABM0XFE3_CAMSA|nr:PREDICTED: probable FBD-associated F-box protein At1g32375 [Camelina sativa]